MVSNIKLVRDIKGRFKKGMPKELHPRWKGGISYKKSKYSRGKNPNSRNGFKKGHKLYGDYFKLNEKHPNWKGNDVNLGGLHAWIKTRKLKLKKCEFCNKLKKISLANISGEYKRDINDYKWLCYSCHRKKDNIDRKLLGKKLTWRFDKLK